MQPDGMRNDLPGTVESFTGLFNNNAGQAWQVAGIISELTQA